MTKVRAPASIANLGTGFDVLALALDIWLEVEAEPSREPGWEFVGEGAQTLARGPNPFSDLRMRGRVSSSIPVGVGLGSSAAARVAALAVEGAPRDGLLEEVAAQEGHADNAAAVVMGGMVLVCGRQAHALPMPDLEVALFVAQEPLPTEEARSLLPVQVARQDAVQNSARLALLVHVLHSRHWQHLEEAFDDRLHQPQRTALYPWLPSVIGAARAAGAHGAFLAGAGPSVAALCEPGLGLRTAQAMTNAAGVAGRPLVTRATDSGVQVG